MKKLVFLNAIFFAMIVSATAQWTSNSYGIYPLNLNHHLSINMATPNTQMEFTLNGQQIIQGTGASLLFGGLVNTTVGWGEYGIEYNVADGGLNFWKPFGNSYNGSVKNWVLFLGDNGNVGIGTNTLAKGFKLTVDGNITARRISIGTVESEWNYLLTVAGGIHAREVLVTETAGGADFVFEKNFELRSLPEL